MNNFKSIFKKVYQPNSSKKRIAGAASRARLNREEIIFSESPTNGEKSSADEMLWKDAAHDVAAARTSSDLPQPGGPYNKTPVNSLPFINSIDQTFIITIRIFISIINPNILTKSSH